MRNDNIKKIEETQNVDPITGQEYFKPIINRKPVPGHKSLFKDHGRRN